MVWCGQLSASTTNVKSNDQRALDTARFITRSAVCAMESGARSAESFACSRLNRRRVRTGFVVKERELVGFSWLISRQAIILGWSHWPCTDMGVYFGSLEPEQTGSITGQVEFSEKSYVPI